MPRPDVISTAISCPTRRGMRSSLTASATVTVAASAVSIVAGSMPTCTLRTITCCPEARLGAETPIELTAPPPGCPKQNAWSLAAGFRARSWQQLRGQLGGVGGAHAVADADVGERVTGLEGELDRGARALGLVRVREDDVGRAERRERLGKLVGRSGAERRRQREVHLDDLEQLELFGQALDLARSAREPHGRRVDQRQQRARGAEALLGLLAVLGLDHGHAERLQAGGERRVAAQRDDRDLRA